MPLLFVSCISSKLAHTQKIHQMLNIASTHHFGIISHQESFCLLNKYKTKQLMPKARCKYLCLFSIIIQNKNRNTKKKKLMVDEFHYTFLFCTLYTYFQVGKSVCNMPHKIVFKSCKFNQLQKNHLNRSWTPFMELSYEYISFFYGIYTHNKIVHYTAGTHVSTAVVEAYSDSRKLSIRLIKQQQKKYKSNFYLAIQFQYEKRKILYAKHGRNKSLQTITNRKKRVSISEC